MGAHNEASESKRITRLDPFVSDKTRSISEWLPPHGDIPDPVERRLRLAQTEIRDIGKQLTSCSSWDDRTNLRTDGTNNLKLKKPVHDRIN